MTWLDFMLCLMAFCVISGAAILIVDGWRK
jgi:hypothetical protein